MSGKKVSVSGTVMIVNGNNKLGVWLPLFASFIFNQSLSLSLSLSLSPIYTLPPVRYGSCRWHLVKNAN